MNETMEELKNELSNTQKALNQLCNVKKCSIGCREEHELLKKQNANLKDENSKLKEECENISNAYSEAKDFEQLLELKENLERDLQAKSASAEEQPKRAVDAEKNQYFKIN